MLDYRDVLMQIRYPGASRCMGNLYETLNMDDKLHPQNRVFYRNDKAESENDITQEDS